MVSNREKMKIAQQAARSGGGNTAWSDLKVKRGGNNCKGCGERWDKMGYARLKAHAECRDSDGCPDTKD